MNNSPVTMCCKYQKELDKNVLRQADKDIYCKIHQTQTIKNNVNSGQNDNHKSLSNIKLSKRSQKP